MRAGQVGQTISCGGLELIADAGVERVDQFRGFGLIKRLTVSLLRVQLEIRAVTRAFERTQAEEEVEVVRIEHRLELDVGKAEALERLVSWVATGVHLLVDRA